MVIQSHSHSVLRFVNLRIRLQRHVRSPFGAIPVPCDLSARHERVYPRIVSIAQPSWVLDKVRNESILAALRNV